MSVPTLTQSPNAFQQPRKSRPMLWIVLGSIIGVLLFAALVGASAFFALQRGGQSYQVHLQLKLEGNAWKIISADSM